MDVFRCERVRIIAADDDEISLLLYRHILSEKNKKINCRSARKGPRSTGEEILKSSPEFSPSFELVTCTQGNKAVENVKRANAENRPFAVAFLDVHMPPGPDGLKTAEMIREADPHIEIVIVTGHADIHPRQMASRIQPANKLLYIQKPFHQYEIFQFASSLGAKWHMECKLEQFHDKLENEIEERTCALRDANESLRKYIADLEELEKKKKELEIRLQHSHRMEAIGTLSGGIAHDFNNILFPLIGYTELAKTYVPADNPAQEKLNEVIQAANRAKNLVGQILTFSRKTEEKMQPFNLLPIFKETIKLLKSSFPSTIRFHQNIELQDGLVNGDPSKIQQILMNLCTNAYQSVEEEGGDIEVTLTNIRIHEKDYILYPDIEPGSFIKLEVIDNGCGMDRKTLRKIFDPYFTTKPEGEGTGLGLSIVHGIVKNHGGHIHVYSEPGHGTRFSIYLPLLESRKKAEESLLIEEPPFGNGESILLVDDEIPVLRVEKEALENLGYRVTIMQDSEEALSLFGKAPQNFDLLITDLTMPKLDGIALTQEILKIRPELPVILCTGFSESKNGFKKRAEALNIAKILNKPLRNLEMAKSIRGIIGAKIGA